MASPNGRPSRLEDLWLTISVLMVLGAALSSGDDGTWRMIVAFVCVLSLLAIVAKRLRESPKEGRRRRATK